MGENEQPGQLILDLDFSALRVSRGSFSPKPGSKGGLLSFSVEPLTSELVARLDRAAHEHALVRIRFSGDPLLMELLTLERKEAHSVRIVAHVFDPAANQ
jgi:hypothetical protein